MTQVANTLIPNSDSCDLGSPTQPWRNVYATNLPSSSVPVGAIQMYTGSTAPTGWLLCDGSDIAVTSADSSDYDYSYEHQSTTVYRKATNTDYRNLVKIIGRTYGHSNSPEDTYVRLPNLKQRFPIGYDNVSRYNQIFKIYDFYSDWNFPISQLVNPDNGNFRKIQGLSPEAAAMRSEEGKLIDRVSDFYNISLTSTTLDDKVDEINSKTIFGLGSTGGKLMHTLTEDEMPRHAHQLVICEDAYDGTNSSGCKAGDNNDNIDWRTPADMTAESSNKAYTGGGKPHNNVPPYLVVNFIIKY